MITKQHLNQLPQIFTDVYYGNLDALEQYIQQGGDVNIDTGNVIPHFRRCSLFQFACSVGQCNIVERLLVDEHINPQASGNRAIRWAARYGHLAIVNRLLEVDCDPQDDNNEAIRWAARYGHLAVVNRLLEVGCNPKADNSEALYLAAKYGHLDVMNRLIEVGCDISLSICIAAENGHLPVVNRLIELGTNPQIFNNVSICRAAANGHKKVVCALYDVAYRQGNPIPRNITPEVEAILDERIEYVSVMPMFFSNLARQHQNTAWFDIAPQILEFEDRLNNNDIEKVKQKGMAILQIN